MIKPIVITIGAIPETMTIRTAVMTAGATTTGTIPEMMTVRIMVTIGTTTLTISTGTHQKMMLKTTTMVGGIMITMVLSRPMDGTTAAATTSRESVAGVTTMAKPTIAGTLTRRTSLRSL